MKIKHNIKTTLSCAVLLASTNAFASGGFTGNECSALPSHSELTDALRTSVEPSGGPANGGFELNMWAVVVNRDGVVCAVTFSGDNRGDQWPASRVISAQKAYTANSLSLDGLALGTGNLFTAVQPGNSLFGLQESNPVDPSVAYGADGSPRGKEARATLLYGTSRDPLVGDIPGGVNVFGGGLALYDDSGRVIGAVGVSGDSSCADHNIAWRVREEVRLGTGNVPEGDNGLPTDAINYTCPGEEVGGFDHPLCGGTEDSIGFNMGAASVDCSL